jgi:8-oxo-dGTP diphosphatase
MSKFNVRVYGILIHENRVLVSDEFIKGLDITKFPGGGLEYGEGTVDCVIREFKEELQMEVEVVSHFYTTDFFVNSAFSTTNQIISIYYTVVAKDSSVFLKPSFKLSDNVFDYERKDGAQSMRWIDLHEISENDFTLIIDKRVGAMLAQTLS